MDSIGAAFGGFQTKSGKITVEYVKDIDGKQESTLVGDGTKVPCEHAAFANAHLGGILDFDDVYSYKGALMGHPGSPMVFSALAVAESLRSSGKDFLTAVIAAYEVGGRVLASTAASDDVWLSAVYPFSCADAFGPPVAAGKLLGLNEEQLYHAIGVAGSNARIPVASLQMGAMTKNSQAWISETGVQAAFLAKRGFTGVPGILDGEGGFGRFCRADRYDPTIFQSFGREYFIEGVCFKLQPACRCNHVFFEAAMDVMNKYGIKAEDIEKIRFKSFSRVAIPPYNNPEPKDMFQAMFSIPWTVALGVLGYEPGPDWFTDERFRDPRVIDLTHKVVLEPDPAIEEEWDKKGDVYTEIKAEITVKGKVYEARRSNPRGDPPNPATDEELRTKFRGMTRKVIGDKTEELLKKIERLQELRDVSELTRLFKS